MAPENDNARGQAGEVGTQERDKRSNHTATPRKWQRVAAALLTGQSFTRFEAERELSDHTLPSTISTLQAKGLTVLRCDVTVPGFQGIATHCCKYWLDRTPENLDRARRLLGMASAPPREQIELLPAQEGR